MEGSGSFSLKSTQWFNVIDGPKAEPKDEPKAEPKDEPKAEPKDRPKDEPKDRQKAEPKDGPKTEKTILNALWRVWEDHEPMRIPETTYTLRGFSIAALRTHFYI